MPSFTKAYLRTDAAPYTPATIRGAWDDAASAVTRALGIGGTVGDDAITTVSVAEAVSTNPYDVLLYRGVSAALSAQTIAGTVDVVLGVSESNTLADFNLHLHIYVTQGDSDTPRGDLLTDFIEGAGVKEWPTTAAGIVLSSAQALSSLGVSAGDRLVVEIGYRSRNSVTTSRAGVLRYGTTSAVTRLPAEDLTDGSTDVTALAGFIEFSAAITTPNETARVTQVVSEVVSHQSSAGTARVTAIAAEVVWKPPAPDAPSQNDFRPTYPDEIRPFETRPLLAPIQAAILLPFARTRFYFPSTSPSVPVSPTFGTGWTRTDLADRLILNPVPKGTAFASVTRAMDTSANPGIVLTRQYISESLHAGRLDGAIRGVMRAEQSHNNVDGALAVRVALCNSTGGNLREVLAVTTVTPTATPPEFERGTLTARRFQDGVSYSVPVTTPTAIDEGDHLIVEVGFREDANQPSRTATLGVGDFLTTLDQSTDDLPENETTTTALNPWIEFSVAIEILIRWTPVFPDAVRAVDARAHLMPAFVRELRPDLPDPLQWEPTYPDTVSVPSEVVAPSTALAWEAALFPTTVALFRWQPGFPDYLWREEVTADQQPAFVTSWSPTFPSTNRAWDPVYPSQFLRRTHDRSLLEGLFLSPIAPIPNDASPELAWQPIYPAWIDRRASVAGHSQRFEVLALPVIPTVTDLSWGPQMPARYPYRYDRPDLQHAFSWLYLFPTPDLLATLHWRTEFPAHFPVPPPPPGGATVPPTAVSLEPVAWDPRGELQPERAAPFFPAPEIFQPNPGVFLVVAAQQAWKPGFPDYLWRIVPVTDPTGGGWTPVPSLAPPAVLCVQLVDEAVTSPQIASAALTLSTILDAAVTSPRIRGVEVC